MNEPDLYVVFADYMISSSQYAILCRRYGAELEAGGVIQAGTSYVEKPTLYIEPMTDSFEEFLRRCLDDSSSIGIQ